MLNLIFKLAGLLAAAALVVVTSSNFVGRALPMGAQIAYAAQVNAYVDIYLLDLPRMLRLNLTQRLPEAARAMLLDSTNTMLDWSPDGTRLAYISQRNGFALHTLDLAGTHTTLLTSEQPLRSVEWSPDNTTLIYVRWQPNRFSDIFTIDEAGVQLAVARTHDDERQPRWSPDGRRFAYLSSLLLTLREEGGEVRHLTHNADRVLIHQFDWSPDGERLVFSAIRFRSGFSSGDLYLIDIESGTLQLLKLNGALNVGAVKWSPDGARLAFASDHEEGEIALYLWDLAKTAPQRLTNTRRGEWTPQKRRFS